MYYILKRDVRLMRWKGSPPFYSQRPSPKRHPLTEEEDAFLRQCDGKTELPDGFLADRLEASGLIRPCAPGEASLLPGQAVTYPNIFVAGLDWNLTDRCNYNCLHCFHAADNSAPREEFSLPEALRFLDGVRACGIASLRLTGGEPTLHPQFVEILAAMRERGIRLNTLITNGSRLDDDLLARIKALHPGAEIMISFDGIGTHDWLRQHPGSEQQALEAIRRCKRAGFRVLINCNVNRKNRDVLPRTVALLAEENVDLIRVIRTSESPRWTRNMGDMTLTPEEYYALSAELARQHLANGIQTPLNVWQSLYLLPKRRAFSCFPVKSGACRYTGREALCAAMLQKPSVLANGELNPCTAFAGYLTLHGVHMENVKTLGLQAALTEGRFVSVVTKTAAEKLRANPECAACAWAKSCQGGCPALSLIFGGDILSADRSKCAFFRGGWYDEFCRILDGWTNLNPI